MPRAYFTGCGTSASTRRRGNDLISMLAHAPATRNMPPMEYLGNLILLIVGGNDTTRNSISGGLLALNQNPDEYAQAARQPGADPEHGLRDHPLADAARAHAPHRAAGHELRGKQIRKGDKVVMWYISGNRDEEAIENPDSFIIDRPGRASTCRSASAFTAAWATGWPRCSCGSCGKRC